MIAEQYSRLEQLNEVPPLDTSDLDALYFSQGKLDKKQFVKGIFSTYLPRFEPVTDQKINAILQYIAAHDKELKGVTK